MSNSALVWWPPSSSTTTLAPAEASRDATMAPPGPLPTTQTSGFRTRSRWTSAPVTMRPAAISAFPRGVDGPYQLVRRAWIADGGIRLRRPEVHRGGEPLQGLESGAADGETRGGPGAQVAILLPGGHPREGPRRSAHDDAEERVVEEHEELLQVLGAARVERREKGVGLLGDVHLGGKRRGRTRRQRTELGRRFERARRENAIRHRGED